MITKPITSDEAHWRYEPPPDPSAKTLLLNRNGVAILGAWGLGIGIIAWCPLPKRNKELEERLC